MDVESEIGYSRRMTNDVVPLIQVTSPPTHFSPHGRVGKAWQAAWALMVAKGAEFTDANELAAESANTQGLSPATMMGVLSRQAKAGVLERDYNVVDGTRGPRKRTQYRIPQS